MTYLCTIKHMPGFDDKIENDSFDLTAWLGVFVSAVLIFSPVKGTRRSSSSFQLTIKFLINKSEDKKQTACLLSPCGSGSQLSAFISGFCVVQLQGLS